MKYRYKNANVDSETMNTIIKLIDEDGNMGDVLELTPLDSDALAGRLNVLNATRMQMRMRSKKQRGDSQKGHIWSRKKD